jgi:hypothetical protein
MDLILNHKWLILLSFEVSAWGFTFLMFYARYWIESKKLFFLFTFLAFLTGWVPHLALMIMNFFNSKTIGSFEITVLLLLLYGLTIGKKHLLKLDSAIAKLSKKKKINKKMEKQY